MSESEQTPLNITEEKSNQKSRCVTEEKTTNEQVARKRINQSSTNLPKKLYLL